MTRASTALESTPNEYEIKHARRLLEGIGYIVRSPEQVDLPVMVRLSDEDGATYTRRLRVEILLNGQRLAVEATLSDLENGETFRGYLSGSLASKLARHIVDDIKPKIAAAVEAEMAR